MRVEIIVYDFPRLIFSLIGAFSCPTTTVSSSSLSLVEDFFFFFFFFFLFFSFPVSSIETETVVAGLGGTGVGVAVGGASSSVLSTLLCTSFTPEEINVLYSVVDTRDPL